MSLEQLEAEIERLDQEMGAAYDRGDMRAWERLRVEANRVREQFRRLCDEE